MAYYAFLDENNIVVQVITGVDEYTNGVDWEHHYGAIKGMPCKRSSFNTSQGQHLAGKTPYRKNHASIGYTYDEERDAFIPPKEYDSWVLDENKGMYVPPLPKPELTEGQTGAYLWNENLYQSDNTQGWEYVDYT